MYRPIRPYYTRWWYRNMVALIGGLNVALTWVDCLIGDAGWAVMNGGCAVLMFWLLWATRVETGKWWNR